MVDAVIKMQVTEGRETMPCNFSVKKELDYCNSCLELKEKCNKAEERCTLLELEIENKKTEIELLESARAALELEKLVLEDEARLLNKKNKEHEHTIMRIGKSNLVSPERGKCEEEFVDLINDTEGEKVLSLMIENRVLECEKKKAESEVEVWMKKWKELELRVLELEKNLSSTTREHTLAGMVKVEPELPGTCKKGCSEVNGLQDGFHDAATPVINSLCSNLKHGGGTGIDAHHDNVREYNSRARKQLVFGEEGILNKKTATVTSSGAGTAPVGIIDVFDSDDEVDTTNYHKHEIQTTKRTIGSIDGVEVTPDIKDIRSKTNLSSILWHTGEDDVIRYGGSASSFLTKRKRAFNIVTSESESETNTDDIRISMLMADKESESHALSLSKSNDMRVGSSRDKTDGFVTKRRLVTLRQSKQESPIMRSTYGLKSSVKDNFHGIPTDGTFTDDELVDNETCSEGESLNGFIVRDSDVSEDRDLSNSGDVYGSERSCTDDSSGESEDVSDSSNNYDGIISRIGRRKKHVRKWEFEADMLAAFGKDPELCMRAVCALYRQQTSDEKSSKATIHSNQRGFSQCDAPRGSRLGEFLTDGDPQGDLKKSVNELQEYDSKGIETCRSLATRYSRQLFAMYENREDPLWHALETK